VDRDDIIRMAREAGISKPWDQEPVKWETLERFAKLVSSHEKKKLTDWMDKRGYSAKHSNSMESLLVSLDVLIIEKWNDSLAKSAAIEREECIKICKNLVKEYGAKKQAGNEIAAAIRMRDGNGL
jgi:hypothetical protein